MSKTKQTYSKNSQAGRLLKLVKQAIIAVIAGTLLLITFIGSNFLVSYSNEALIDSILALNQYRLGSKTLTYNVQSYAVTGDQKYYDAYMRELDVDQNRDEAIARLKTHDITDEEWAAFDEIAAYSNGLVPLEVQAMEYAAAGDTAAAQECVFGGEYQTTVDQINRLTDDTITHIQDRKGAQVTNLHTIQIVLEVIFFLSFAYVVWQFFKTIKFSQKELLEPVKKVSKQMVALSEGDFSVELDMQEDDSEVGTMVSAIDFMKKNLLGIVGEISHVLELMGDGNYQIDIKQNYVGEYVRIKESFIKISDKMRETLQTIREVSNQIDMGSEQLASAAKDLAEGSTTQAGQLSDLVNIIEEMAKSIEQSAKEADNSVMFASQAGETMMAGNAKMEELKNAIDEISKCSEQINTIISAIEDIASETNLLSLNASIEAARAGEAGRGFAVVAEQVKNLAEESTKAAGRTTELIVTTIAAVERGISIADETAANMEKVIVSAGEATDKMSELARMLDEDVEHIHHVNDDIAKVSAVVDNNSAASEETAAVSEQQKEQVETMVSLMDQFKL